MWVKFVLVPGSVYLCGAWTAASKLGIDREDCEGSVRGGGDILEVRASACELFIVILIFVSVQETFRPTPTPLAVHRYRQRHLPFVFIVFSQISDFCLVAT